jgi:hypothetical protein
VAALATGIEKITRHAKRISARVNAYKQNDSSMLGGCVGEKELRKIKKIKSKKSKFKE